MIRIRTLVTIIAIVALLSSVYALGGYIGIGSVDQDQTSSLTTDSCSNSITTSIANTSSGTQAAYHRQLALLYANSTKSLKVNVTALEQSDRFGYGPAYLLNGLTDKLYWYQVGVTWNLPTSSDTGFIPGFRSSFQVWAPNGTSIYPSNNSSAIRIFSGQVSNNDIIELHLSFSNGTVAMTARDLQTNASASQNYAAVGASTFVEGNLTHGFFTGLMTEWWQVCQNFSPGRNTTFFDYASPPPYAKICIAEAKNNNTGSYAVFSSCTPYINLRNATELYPFTTHGFIAYADRNEFITD